MKKSIVNNRTVLEADAGKIITDGKELFSNKLYLGNGICEDTLHEITTEEYKNILAEQEAKALAEIGV